MSKDRGKRKGLFSEQDLEELLAPRSRRKTAKPKPAAKKSAAADLDELLAGPKAAPPPQFGRDVVSEALEAVTGAPARGRVRRNSTLAAHRWLPPASIAKLPQGGPTRKALALLGGGP